VIRPETPADADAIARAVELAFGRPAEAELVVAIRASDGFVPELSLVAEEGGEIVGHVMLSYVPLGDRKVLQLAPMAVVPQRQSQGIGGALVRAVLERADGLGAPLVLVVGHADYYPRFGFEPARALGIEPPAPFADEVWMARRLTAYDPTLRGTARFPPAFDGA
jgi:putative acetyltransferase